MRAVPRPHENWKNMLLAGRLEMDHIEQFARLLAGVHRRAWEQRDRLASEFDDRGFFESLRIEPYYLYSAEQRPGAKAFLQDLVAQTRGTRYTLVHGDFSPKNILVHDGRLILLDHEAIHFGDGAFDLGFSMAHLLSKAHHLAQMRVQFADATKRYWANYAQRVGDPYDISGGAVRFPPPVPRGRVREGADSVKSSLPPQPSTGVPGEVEKQGLKVSRPPIETVAWRNELESRAVRHTLGCLLARCVGRSPLEYLTDSQKMKQSAVVEMLMQRAPAAMATMIDQFIAMIDRE
jgi:hypothetical protein